MEEKDSSLRESPQQLLNMKGPSLPGWGLAFMGGVAVAPAWYGSGFLVSQ